VPDGLALNCGVYEIRMRNANAMTKNLMKDLLPERGTAREMFLINVVPHVNQSFPPCYVMTASDDPIAGPPAQKKFVEKLRAKGVPVTEKTWGTEEAPLKHVFHLNIRMEEAVRLNDEECEFFRSLMKEKEE
jgi:acetyl esterase/lipase